MQYIDKTNRTNAGKRFHVLDPAAGNARSPTGRRAWSCRMSADADDQRHRQAVHVVATVVVVVAVKGKGKGMSFV